MIKYRLGKLEDKRTVEISTEDDSAEYQLANGVTLLVREIAIGYKWHSGLKEWQVQYVNLDGWRKGKPQSPTWWVWSNALDNWLSYEWLVAIVMEFTPDWAIV